MKDTFDSSIPRYDLRFLMIHTAWRWYTLLFRKLKTIMKPDT